MLSAPVKNTAVQEFTRVPLCVLDVLETSSVDLYIQFDYDKSKQPILYRAKGYPLSGDGAFDSKENCKYTLFVRDTDSEKFSKDLNSHLGKNLEKSLLPISNKFQLLQQAISIEIERSVRLVDCDEFISHASVFGNQISTLLTEEDILPGDLFEFVRHDYCTFVHVTNVAAYATILAKLMGCKSRKLLEQIAIGGLLHDLGKRRIPNHILNKTGSLTRDEWEIIKKHPQYGYEELRRRENISHGQLMMAYQHHEKIDGTGYPVGLTASEIHPWAKLLAVVDVFEALTGDRPYRKPCSGEEALQILEKGAGTHFDKEIVRCWTLAVRKR